MKKELKKLTISRETLRSLEERDLREAAGGDSIQNSCTTISWRTCTTSDRC